MTIVLFLLSLFIAQPAPLSAQEIKPLYQIPEYISARSEIDSTTSPIAKNILIGTDEGLFRVTNKNVPIPLWKEGRVDQMQLLTLKDAEGNWKATWMFRTSKGLYFSSDLEHFEERNNGLPFLTVKKYKNGETTLEKQIQEIEDICANPINNQEMVTATKDNVYISRDGGLNWTSIGSMSRSTAGNKAVAIATIQGQTVVFMAHPIFGLSYILPDAAKPAWIDVAAGFEKMESLTSPDEIADILPVSTINQNGTVSTEIYISQSYIPRIYRFNWTEKRGELLYKGTEPVQVIDGLTMINNVLLYTTLEGFGSLNIETLQSQGTPKKEADWYRAFGAVPGMTNTAYLPPKSSGFNKGLTLNELWLLFPGTINSPYAEKANGKKSIYASAYQCRNDDGIKKYKKIVKDRNMNSIVIDMKDDYGYLRYDSHDELVLKKGKTSMYAIPDLNHFIDEFKKDNIYLVARIVTFKDKTLASYAGGKYAVWDAKNNKPWVGIRGYNDVTDEEGNVTGQETDFYDENWVDPYSEEVWEYNIHIAQELIARGFDEIQFDYIRFPTDGINLRNAQYRWRSKGMDMESALISFLSYARENIQAPIGIDIYGANGWYRSGTRTGQSATMLAEYVDVIGPMFYPSHFEQSFLNYAPAADRTYRIYYYGSFRNTVMCRNRAIIRPWIQSFYLNVSYDRLYYNSDYIAKQFFGTRDSINRGYMCWNNSGDYSMTPPDVSDTEPFTGTAPEASTEFRKPAIGNRIKPLVSLEAADLSILDSIREQYGDDDYSNRVYTPFLQVLPQ